MIAVGTMTWGREADEAEARRMYSLARERGVVWFDSASSYSDGEAERILGRCLRDDPKRAKVRISTKGGYRGEDIREELRGSLERLGVERVELYLHHRWMKHGSDRTWFEMRGVWRDGLCDEVGLSNCAAWQAAQTSPIVDAIQVLYSLGKRQAEVELLPFAAANEVRVFAYSPLAAGLLTGKYDLDGEILVIRSMQGRLLGDARYRRRFADWPGMPSGFAGAARDLNMTPAQLAVSWVMGNPTCMVIPIVGARTVQQLDELLGARPLDVETWRRVGAMFPAPPPATDRLEEAT